MSVFTRFTHRRRNSQQGNDHSTSIVSPGVNAVSKQVNGTTNKSNTLLLEGSSEANDPTITRETVSDTFAEYA